MPLGKPYRVLLVDDEPAIRRAYKLLLGPMVTDEAGTLGEARALLRSREREERPYAAVLIDLGLPDGDGEALVAECRVLVPKPVCMVLSGNLDPPLVVRLGLKGVVAMPKLLVDRSLPLALRTLIEERGGEEPADPLAALRHLSRVQRDIVRLTLEGMTAKECAAQLRVGVRTIETHWERIFQKTGARSKVQLIGSLCRNEKR